MDKKIRMMGTPFIPANRKEAYIEDFLKVARAGGMVEIVIEQSAENNTQVLRPVEIKENGDIELYYNQYQQNRNGRAGYNAESGQIYCDDLGEGIFAKVIKALFSLTEMYSETACLTMCDNNFLDAEAFSWLSFVLERDINISKRYDLWGYYETFYIDALEVYSEKEAKELATELAKLGCEMLGMEGADAWKELFYVTQNEEYYNSQQDKRSGDQFCYMLLKDLFDKVDNKETLYDDAVLWASKPGYDECCYGDTQKISLSDYRFWMMMVGSKVAANIISIIFHREYRDVYKDIRNYGLCDSKYTNNYEDIINEKSIVGRRSTYNYLELYKR